MKDLQDVIPEARELHPYMPNRDLVFTESAEIKRLLKVVEEKNQLIKKFKEFDKQRCEEYHRMEQDVALMEERFAEFNKALEDCDDICDADKKTILTLYKRWFKQLMSFDRTTNMMQKVRSQILNVRNSVNGLYSAASEISDLAVHDKLTRKIAACYEKLTEIKAVIDGDINAESVELNDMEDE